MESAPNNILTNKLGSGLNEADVSAAVKKSGYPLQTIVSNLLRSQFHFVQEEWSYVDRDTNDLRNIDILAEKRLYDFTEEQPIVRPTLDLLIECKQSDLPYVFFLSSGRSRVSHLPLLAGLFTHSLTITTDDDLSTWNISIPHAFGIDTHPFITEPDYCMLFTKCNRKGSDVVLSGSESFNGIVLPMIKAMHHFQIAESPPKTAMYFDCHLTVGIGVLDAPMIGVRVSEQSHDLIYLPWVRVLRHETDESYNKKLFAIDIVHKDFLEEYLNVHLLPFAENFSHLAIKHQQILASGEAFVKGMGKNWWCDFEQRLEPKKTSQIYNRSKIIGKSILRILTGEKNR